MKGVIIYKSKYGSTKEHAEWLQQGTGFELYEVKQAPADLRGYDVVVIGSSIFAGRLVLTKWIRERWASLQGKHIFLLLVNITADKELLAKVVPNSLPPEIAAQIKVFPVGGRYAPQRMAWLDRTMINTVAKLEKRPEIREELLAERDWVNRENLRKIEEAIGELLNADFGLRNAE